MKKLLIFATMMALVSCNSKQESKTEENQPISEYQKIDSTKVFLIENGFNQDADLSDAQLKELKEWVDSGTFNEVSVCQAFYDLLPMGDKEGREYLSKFKLPKGKTIDHLSMFLNFTGRQVCFKTPEPKVQKTKEEVDALFSSVDGSLPGLVKLVKEQMKNPSSFEHVETSYKDIKTKIIVKMKYRGTNSFNAVVPQEVTATADHDGNVIKIYKNE